MKLNPYHRPAEPSSVAPFVGAWIETRPAVYDADEAVVAPFVGAWIETQLIFLSLKAYACVAPFVGAWIET